MRRPMLRPGLQILRRDLRTIQLGLDWPGVATISDSTAMRAVLDAIDGFRDTEGVLRAASHAGPPRADCEQALATLIECGAVVDETALDSSGVAEETWAAWWLLAGPLATAGEIASQRARCTVHVVGDGSLADDVRHAVRRAGLVGASQLESAQLVIAASDQEPRRDLADELMHTGIPHLWAYLRDLVGVVGPFVLPGSTACLRCIDASRTDLDRTWPNLLDSAAVRPLRVPPRDPALAALVSAWAAHEATIWASALRPQTCDQLIELPYGFGPVETMTFAPHPHCGCGWPIWQDTMGA